MASYISKTNMHYLHMASFRTGAFFSLVVTLQLPNPTTPPAPRQSPLPSPACSVDSRICAGFVNIRSYVRTFSRMVQSMLTMFRTDADVVTKYRAHVVREAVDVAALGEHKFS